MGTRKISPALTRKRPWPSERSMAVWGGGGGQPSRPGHTGSRALLDILQQHPNKAHKCNQNPNPAGLGRDFFPSHAPTCSS